MKGVSLSMVTSIGPGDPDGPSYKMGTGLYRGRSLSLCPNPWGPFSPALQGPQFHKAPSQPPSEFPLP